MLHLLVSASWIWWCWWRCFARSFNLIFQTIRHPYSLAQLPNWAKRSESIRYRRCRSVRELPSGWRFLRQWLNRVMRTSRSSHLAFRPLLLPIIPRTIDATVARTNPAQTISYLFSHRLRLRGTCGSSIATCSAIVIYAAISLRRLRDSRTYALDSNCSLKQKQRTVSAILR